MIKRHAVWKVLSTLCTVLSAFFTPTADAKEVYGFMTGNADPGTMPIGIYKFDTTDGNSLELQEAMMLQLWGGAYAEGYYYMMLSNDASGYVPAGLCRYDFKTNKTQIGYAYQEYQCSDMSYDYSTGTMYGIMVRNGGEPIQHQLIKIDLKSGAKTLVAKLNDKVTAIACNYFGDLYAMSADSKLYIMDTQTGAMTFVGDTGIRTNTAQAQSMEFDRETGELYWTGLDNSDFTFLYKINPYTGSVEGLTEIYNNALLAALHIPFKVAADNAPAKVENLSAAVTDNSITLKWTNPSKTYGGEALSSPVTKIEIQCNGKILKSIELSESFSAEEWTDQIPEGTNGKLRYIVYAYNKAGRGEPASCIAMVGEDIPDKVSGLTVENIGTTVKLTWEAPTKGKNGGSLNAESLRYTVTRNPDGKVFDDIAGHEFIDTTLPAAAFCSYQVVCYNAQGKSDAVITETQTVGGTIIPPYEADFTDVMSVAQWKIVDANQDNMTWTCDMAKGIFSCYTFSGSKSDDSLVSVPFTLKKDKKYVVKYKINATSFFGTSEHFRLSLKNKESEKVLEDLPSFTTDNTELRSVELTVDTDGEYSFIMSAISEPDQWSIEISGFAVEISAARDLAVTAIDGLDALTQDAQTQYKVSIENKGTDAINSYTILLTDQDSQLLSETEYTNVIVPGETKVIDIEWTPASTMITSVTATVAATGDEIPQNNSATKTVTVIPSDEKYIEMGGTDSFPTLIPFGFCGNLYSYTQTIYRPEDTGGKSLEVSELLYDYINNGNALNDKQIKIYMSNVTSGSVTSGWVAEQSMTLVFDGQASFNQGKGILRIVFNEPFQYTGGNLCIMCQKHKDAEIGNIRFFAKDYGDEARTAIYYGDNESVNMSEVVGSTMLSHVTMRAKDADSSGVNRESMTDSDILIYNGIIDLSGLPANILVTDLSGKVVAANAKTSTLDISHLQSGIYIVKVEAEGVNLVRKFVVK